MSICNYCSSLCLPFDDTASLNCNCTIHLFCFQKFNYSMWCKRCPSCLKIISPENFQSNASSFCSIPKNLLLSSSEINKSCEFCHNHFHLGTRVDLLACEHSYHFGCLKKWLESFREGTCNFCETKILQLDLLWYSSLLSNSQQEEMLKNMANEKEISFVEDQDVITCHKLSRIQY